MAKLHHSSTHQQKMQTKSIDDLCPMCKESLSLDEEYTQRVGLLDEDDYCIGWMCPHCKATFDEDSAFTGIHGMDEMGEA